MESAVTDREFNQLLDQMKSIGDKVDNGFTKVHQDISDLRVEVEKMKAANKMIYVIGCAITAVVTIILTFLSIK